MPNHRILIIEINFLNVFFRIELKYVIGFILPLIDIVVNPEANKVLNFK
jgi:hypothetical protein